MSSDPSRFEKAVYVASACGEPETSEFTNSKEAAWGELEEDYPPRDDVTASTKEEVEDFYNSFHPEDIQIKD